MNKKMYGEGTKVIWTDKKRIFGLPISFTRYSIVEKEGVWMKIYYDTGFLSTRHEEVMMYRVIDISLRQSVFDRLFNVGNILLYCKDESMEYFDILKVKNPFAVKDLISDLVEQQREEKGVRISEFHG